MSHVFETFPAATWCFDIGHARQIDPTIIEAWRLLNAFGDRLRQVNSASGHDRLAIAACRQVSHLIPDAVPVILESVIPPEELGPELHRARAALPAASEVPDPRLAAGGWLPVAGD